MKTILFSTPMVQAILEGRKTMTRRVITPQPCKEVKRFERFIETVDCGFEARFGNDTSVAVCDRKPKYKPGDILWVRETWSRDESGEYVYRINYGTTEDDSFPPSMFKWKPSIHMPREAARIFLRVTNVRVERLQDITDADILAEGFKCREDFIVFWDILNEKRGHGWNKNDWVYAYTFEKISREEAKRLEGMK
jgi:hypothetical protein